MSEGPTLVSNTAPEQHAPSVVNNSQTRPSGHRNRAPRRPRQGGEGQSTSQTPRDPRPDSNRGGRGPRNGGGRPPRDNSRPDGSEPSRPRRASPNNNPGPSDVAAISEELAQVNLEDSSLPSSGPSRPTRQQRSRKQFGSQLTSATPTGSTRPANERARAHPKAPAVVLDDLDLTSRLIHSFTHKDDALDCPICFNSIHPAQPIWSCSPSSETDICCWGTFHLKCIRSWAAKSTSVLF